MAGRRNIATDQEGAAAVEFALVASLLIITILFLMSVGLLLYLNQSMDRAATKAGRQIMVGAVQTAGTSRDDFRTSFICANLPQTFDCSKVIVNVQTITQAAQPGGYCGLLNANQTGLAIPSSTTAQYSPGAQQSYEYVQIVYTVTFLPATIASLLGGGTTLQRRSSGAARLDGRLRNGQY